MKSYLIYIDGHEASEGQAKDCYASCVDMGFDVEYFKGTTPLTLLHYETHIGEYVEMDPSRAVNYKFENHKKYMTKKSCFMNHVRLWNICIQRDEPIAVLEHDAICKRSWDNVEFDEVLCMNLNSAVHHDRNLRKNIHAKYEYTDSGNTKVLPIDYDLRYWHDNIWKGGALIPGTAAYAVTPKGAKRLLESLELNGWDQSDFFINGNNVNLDYASPEYFKFNKVNLRTSWGI